MINTIDMYDINVKPPVKDFLSAVLHDTNKRISEYQNQLKYTVLTKKARKTLEIQLNEEKQSLDLFNGTYQNNKAPEGFDIKMVFFEKVSSEANNFARNEFVHSVKAHFIRFLVEKELDALKKLGVCDHGISVMKNGKLPVDKNGIKYLLTIDHENECIGGGRKTKEKGKDKIKDEYLLGINNKDTYIINHFKNLRLLQDPIHDLKNALNRLQRTSFIPDEKGQWVAMLLPKKEGFIAPYQNSPLYSIKPKIKKQTILKTFNNQVQVLIKRMDEFIKMPKYTKRRLTSEEKKLGGFIQDLKSCFDSTASKNSRKRSLNELKLLNKLMNNNAMNTLVNQINIAGLKTEERALKDLNDSINKAIKANSKPDNMKTKTTSKKPLKKKISHSPSIL